MFISTWQVVAGAIGLAFFWFARVMLIDYYAAKKARIEAEEAELRDRARRHVYQIQADRILEELVSSGSPSILLTLRRTTERLVPCSDLPQTPSKVLESYLRFHEAMKLYEAD